MNPPTCKTCGRRTDLHDMDGNYRCFSCRAELWPDVFGRPVGSDEEANQ